MTRYQENLKALENELGEVYVKECLTCGEMHERVAGDNTLCDKRMKVGLICDSCKTPVIFSLPAY